MKKTHIGCQGWNYADWVSKVGEKVFYPRGTRSAAMLEIYAQAFDSIEVDSTFYAVPTVEAFENWHRRTPQHFTFSLKLPQEITHKNNLDEAADKVFDRFCANADALKEKLAVILVQMPPDFEFDEFNEARLRRFLKRLPDDKKFAFEFRSRSWLTRKTVDMLEDKGASMTLVEGYWLPRERVFQAAEYSKSKTVYARFMGERDLTQFDRVQRPQETNLELWRELFSALDDKGKSLFVYFSNFYEGFAVASANRLKRAFSQEIVFPAELETQHSLF